MDILDELESGDLRTTGRVERVVAEVLRNEQLLAPLIEAVRHRDPAVRMRAADALEKVSRRRAGWLQPYTSELLGDFIHDRQKQVRWHIGQIVPRLQLTLEQAKEVCAVFEEWFADPASVIVRAVALQGVFDLSLSHRVLRRKAVGLIEKGLVDGAPAVRARARILAGH